MTEPKDVPAAPAGTHSTHLCEPGWARLVLGTAATELLNSVIAPPLHRRRVEWMNELSQAVLSSSRRDRALDLDPRQEDDAFITTVMYASQAPIKTQETATRETVRNAVLNAARPHAPGLCPTPSSTTARRGL